MNKIDIVDGEKIITFHNIENSYDLDKIGVTIDNNSVGRYRRVIFCGKMASGKDYARNKFVNAGFTKDVSYTSRPMRPNETDGIDYNFITKEEFEVMIGEDKFFEYTNFCGWYYGTTKESWSKNSVFIFDAHGLKKVPKQELNHSYVVYFDVPLDVRFERLKERVMSDSVERRVSADFIDFKDIKFNLKLTNPKF